MNEDTYRDKLTDLQLEVEELRAQLKEAQTGDLISRQAALTALASTAGVGNRALDKIRALPSAHCDYCPYPDDYDGRVAVVRCKDCKHKHIENMVWTCPFGLPGGELFFCAYGAERRTDERLN